MPETLSPALTELTALLGYDPDYQTKCSDADEGHDLPHIWAGRYRCPRCGAHAAPPPDFTTLTVADLDIPGRVAAGIVALDAHPAVPTGPVAWRVKVAEAMRAGRFNIDDPTRCVLGIIFRDYFIGFERLGLTRDRATLLGFITLSHRLAQRSGGPGDYLPSAEAAELNAEWRRVILAPTAPRIG